MSTNMELDPELAQKLGVLREQPARDPAKAAQGRAAFLEQAQGMLGALPQPVTKAEQRRHIRWMHPLAWPHPLAWIRPRERMYPRTWIKALQSAFHVQRKERSPMFGAFGTILLIVSLILGGSGATVAAAQNSLPDQVLYPVKTWSEDVRTGMASNTQTRLELALEYTRRRAEELQVMLRAGQTPPEAVQARMQAEIDLAIQMAVGQPDGEAVQALDQIRQQLQAHEQLFLNLGKPADPQAAALLDRTRTLLQDRLHLCDVGLQDPDMLRQQLRDRDQQHDGGMTPSAPAMMPVSTRQGNPWTTTPAWLARTPTPGSSYGPGPGDGAGNMGGANTTAGNGGNNPWTTGTPTLGSSYGPGAGNMGGANTTAGNGGNNPWTTGIPTPGSGYGPGPGSGGGSGSSGSESSGGTGSAGSPGGGGSGAGGSSGSGGAGCGGCGTGGSGGSGTGSGGSGSGGMGGRH